MMLTSAVNGCEHIKATYFVCPLEILAAFSAPTGRGNNVLPLTCPDIT